MTLLNFLAFSGTISLNFRSHFTSLQLFRIFSLAQKTMVDVEASSTVAVAGSVCGDGRRLEDLDEKQADDASSIENKRARLVDDVAKLEHKDIIVEEKPKDDVAKPERKDIMGKENPDFPYESRNWRGYARVPTDGGLTHLFGPLGTLLWAGYNRREHFFIAGKSDKWLPCIGAMKRCDKCHSTYPSICEFCAHCGEKLPALQDILPSKRCETCKLTYAAWFRFCSKCGVTLTTLT